MERQVTNGRGANKKAAGTGSRRSWSNREEAVLLVALKDLVSNGWKSDNGFRSGYLNKLEDALKLAFPNTDLQKDPHIISKLTTWRKNYGSVVSAQRDRSGVGFNTSTNLLECTDDQWELIVQKDPTMKGMRYKEWPLFNDWLEVFGKDRATGEIAEDVLDAANTMQAQYSQPPAVEGGADNGDDDCNYVNLETGTLPNSTQPACGDNAQNSTARDTIKTQATSGTSRKRKSKSELNEPSMAVALDNFCRATVEWRDTIASRIGYAKDLGQQRSQIYGLLSNVPGLSMSDKLDATELIGAKNERLEIFMGMNEEARAMYALRLLARERPEAL